MPTYEYKCKVCGEHMDVEQSFTDDTLTTIDGCDVDESGQHQVKKVFGAVGIAFKGDGFYRNDSRSGAKSRSSSSAGSTSSSSDSGTSGSSESSSTDTSSSSSSSDSSSSSGSDSGSTSTSSDSAKKTSSTSSTS